MARRGIKDLAIVGGEVCLDFINTVHQYDQKPVLDELLSFDHLLSWALKVNLVNKATHQAFQNKALENAAKAAHSLERIKQIRHNMYRVFSALHQNQLPDPAPLNDIMDFWKKAVARARFTPSPEGGYWTYPQDCSDLNSLIYPVISNALSLLESPDIRRIRLCEASNCTWLFLDLSKNRSRRWCQMEVCGNREKAKRHYDKIRVGGRG